MLTDCQQLIVFHAFNEDRGTSVCISCIIASVETGAPPQVFTIIVCMSQKVKGSDPDISFLTVCGLLFKLLPAIAL